MTAALAFIAFYTALAAQRLWELRRSARHERALRARGAIEVGATHYPFLIAVHVAWFLGMAAEVAVWGVRVGTATAICFVLYAAAEALRVWAQATLGERWTTRVLVLPSEPRITRGPYRFFPHPNYFAVLVQLVTAPLAFGAWRTAIAGAASFAIALYFRVRAEERGLRAASKDLSPASAGS